MTNQLKHFLSIKETDTSILQDILFEAENLVKTKQHLALARHSLQGLTIVNCFFENSTRTRVSFELAAKRLGAAVVTMPMSESAIQKGETLIDTISTLHAMNCHFIVVRHPQDNILESVCHDLAANVSLINAGTGAEAHPSQALLDLLTIKQHKPDLENLSIAICGDVKHSRVVASQLAIFEKFGVKDVRLIAPQAWLPQQKLAANSNTSQEADKAISGCDVVIALRVQQERLQEDDQIDTAWYRQNFQINEDRLALAKPDAILMHPGPMNRGIEISSAVADGPQSCILQQVTNGVACRMAIFNKLSENYL